jgi:MOSC domain-containing protein YiiM
VVSSDLSVQRLYISPGHNFFGHHGRAPSEHPILEVDKIYCYTGRGIEGDRFLAYKGDYKGQITFFEEEVFENLCSQLQIFDRTPAALRRNVLTRGVRLNDLIGTQFELQGIRFAGVEECRPCYWMNSSFGSGAEDALKGRGGLRARILSDGYLCVTAKT